ncbi:MAG: carboxylating nicotinate-nucleotide diphosphorylase [Candidatus Omnitrophota bacterium]
MNCNNALKIKEIIRNALAEDIGKCDITAKLLITKTKKARAIIFAQEEGIACGISIARLVFKTVDSNIRFISRIKDGNRIRKGVPLINIQGDALSILLGERVALNFLSLLSGIATHTRHLVDKANSPGVKIMDTRKTLPGLRELEKYAVRIGGGHNHRFRLDEMVLIKDNYIKAMSGFLSLKHSLKLRKGKEVDWQNLIKDIRKGIPSKIKIEVEVKNLNEFRLVLAAKPDIIMLDNMKVKQVKKAVRIRKNLSNKLLVSHAGRQSLMPWIEASGNINLKNIRAYAQSGVDFISLGSLTKNAYCLDFSLEIK